MLSQTTESTSGNVVYSEENEYDSCGNLLNRKTNEGTESYTYDRLSRLVTEVYENFDFSHSISYTYDCMGNRTGKSINGTDTSYVYDSLNRLTEEHTSDEDIRYSYDGNGNLVTKTVSDVSQDTGTTEYTYTPKNLLKTAETDEKLIEENVYDAENVRSVRINCDVAVRTSDEVSKDTSDTGTAVEKTAERYATYSGNILGVYDEENAYEKGDIYTEKVLKE